MRLNLAARVHQRCTETFILFKHGHVSLSHQVKKRLTLSVYRTTFPSDRSVQLTISISHPRRGELFPVHEIQFPDAGVIRQVPGIVARLFSCEPLFGQFTAIFVDDS